MQLRIVHTTGYTYEGMATASYNEARMTPLTSTEQIVVHSRLEIRPTPWSYTYRDYFGTQVTAFEALEPHDSLTITSHATVHTSRGDLPPPSMTWEQMRDPKLLDDHTEYLVVTELVQPPEDLAERTRAIARASALPGEAARAICDLLYDEIQYHPGSTRVSSHAADAWEQRGGVCQDIAHLAIGCLRTLGIPARYVSGYLHPRPETPIGDTVVGESHAWVEWWDDGWHGYDPTNRQPISDHHVMVAAGRDYGDVRPLSGIYSGTATSSMFVNVEITRLE